MKFDKIDKILLNLLTLQVILSATLYFISHTTLQRLQETFIASFLINVIVFATSVKAFYFLSIIFIAVKLMKYSTKNKQEITQ